MKSAEFRKELRKIMPGYNWTVHKTSNLERLTATGTQSSGFNRLSTLQVIRSEMTNGAWYEVRSAGHGTKSPWGAIIGNVTLARALRDLQTHYQRQAASYRALAEQLETGRKPVAAQSSEPPQCRAIPPASPPHGFPQGLRRGTSTKVSR